jgi:hypothetical protein
MCSSHDADLGPYIRMRRIAKSFEALLFTLVKYLEFEFVWTLVVMLIIRNNYMYWSMQKLQY